jgi:dihydrofolate reductase
MISFLVAMDRNRVISNGSGLPWGKNQKADLKRFRQLTENHTIILGRNTYKEFKEPLPNRRHIVVSHRSQKDEKNVEFMDFKSALNLTRESDEEVFVIGGEQIFKLFLPYASKIYLTEIDAEYNGSIYFPELDNSWHTDSNQHYEADSKNKHGYAFIDYVRQS